MITWVGKKGLKKNGREGKMVLIEGIWIRGLVELRQCPIPYITGVSEMVMTFVLHNGIYATAINGTADRMQPTVKSLHKRTV